MVFCFDGQETELISSEPNKETEWLSLAGKRRTSSFTNLPIVIGLSLLQRWINMQYLGWLVLLRGKKGLSWSNGKLESLDFMKPHLPLLEI